MVRLRNLSLALTALVGLTLSLPANAQSVSRGPYLQMATPTGITVRWRTDTAATMANAMMFQRRSEAFLVPPPPDFDLGISITPEFKIRAIHSGGGIAHDKERNYTPGEPSAKLIPTSSGRTRHPGGKPNAPGCGTTGPTGEFLEFFSLAPIGGEKKKKNLIFWG